ncbi:MAG: aminodeoxychorismate lyase [Steroidobacteraceae bacterium]|jgi:4-amino-4-deoxychorismate lyase|nr:aminodeoxychorismate lyase [Steroidobacteraceae bacterium]
MRVLVDGAADVGLDPLDRGLQYGDGLFETVAWRRGAPRLAEYHLERMATGCDRLGIPRPPERALLAEMAEVAGAGDATVKVVVTRGSGPRGYRPPRAPSPRRIVAGFEATAAPAGPWQARLCATRLGRNPSLAGLKHLNRLEQVLARAEWDDPGIHEGLMLDDVGRVVCGTQSNLFVAAGGRLVTPRLDECGVAGVMRRAVLAWARACGLDAAEAHVTVDDLRAADEVFVTSALIVARRLSSIDGSPLAGGVLHEEFIAWLEAH